MDKGIIILLSLLYAIIFYLPIFAFPPPVYPGYLYTYDAAGNRVLREFDEVLLRKGSEEETISKIKDCTIKILPNHSMGMSFMF